MSSRVDRLLLQAALEADLVGARVLNLPAGDGALSLLLAEAGMEVASADLFPEHCHQAPGTAVFADMNERLPFPDDAFNAIVCQEGVEHLEDIAGFLRECRRVLCNGGHLWITTPNFMDLSSRLAFLLTGQKSFHAGLPNEESTVWGVEGERLYHGHAFTLPFFQLRYLLRLAQFDGIDLQSCGRSRTSLLLYPAIRPLAGLLLRRGQRRRQHKDRRSGKPHASDGLREELMRHALSRPLLLGKGLIVHARLREGSFCAVPPAQVRAS